MPELALSELGQDVKPIVPESVSLSDSERFSRVDLPKRDQKESPLGRFSSGLDEAIGGTSQIAGQALIYFGDFIRSGERKVSAVTGITPKYSAVPLGNRIVNTGSRIIARNVSALKKKFPDQEPDFIRDLGKGTASLAASLGMGAVAGPLAAGVAFGASTKLSSFVDARKKGKSYVEADAISSLLGFAEGGLEFWGVHQLISSRGGLITRAIKGYVSEALQEASQSIAGGTIETATGLKKYKGMETVKEILTQAAYEGAIGGVLGSAASVPITIVQRRAIEDTFVDLGLEKADAKDAADLVMKQGMDDVMTAVEDIEGEAITADALPEKTTVDGEVVPVTIKQPGEGVREAALEAIDKREKAELKKFEQKQKRKATVVEQLDVQKESIDKLIAETTATKKSFKKAEDAKTVLAQLKERKSDLTEEIKISKSQIVRKKERTLVREKIQQFKQGAKKGAQVTRKQVKELQSEVIRIVNTSGLNAKDKSKFLSSVKNIQTVAQLEKAMPKIEARITQLENKAFKRTTKAAIRKALTNIKPKKIGGKPVGKFTPETQSILNKISSFAKLNSADAQEELAARTAAIGDKEITSEQRLDNKILSMVAGFEESTDSAQLNDLLEEIITIKATGRAGNLLKKFADVERKEALINTAQETIEGSKPREKTTKQEKENRIKKALRSFWIGNYGWNNKLDFLSQDDKTSKENKSKLNEIAKVGEEITAEKKGIRVQGEKVVTMMADAFGFSGNPRKREKLTIRQFRRDSKVENRGTFRNRKGELIKFEISKAQARKRWMELQDPTLRESITGEDQFADGVPLKDIKGNAYSDEMIADIEGWMTQEDKEFALAQLDFYRNYWKTVNVVYESRYGISLPFNEFYSPIQREGIDVDTSTEFLDEINFRHSINPASFKSRIANLHEIKLQNDIEVLQKHILAMEHFKAWADKISDLNTIFGNSEIRETIKGKYGESIMSSIDFHIQSFTSGGTERAKGFETVTDFLRVNFTRSALALKPALTLKQLVSFIAYADNIPIGDFLAGIDEFITEPGKAIKILSESELVKNRSKDFTRDVKDAYASEEYAAFRQNPSFKNFLMFTVRWGDKGAIFLGGWSVYSSHRKQGVSHEDALVAFNEATASSQQSGDLDQLSDWQRGGPLAKLFTMFTSSQNQYFRKEMSAYRNFLKGRMGVKDFAKKVMIYHFILPMLFQWVSDFGKWDEDEQLRAAILGSFNGVFILKDMLDSIVRTGIKTFKEDSDIQVFDSEIAAFGFADGVRKAVGEIDPEDILLEDVLEASVFLANETAGPLTGLPVKQVFNAAEGLKDLDEGEVASGSLKLMGFSPRVIEKNLED